MKRAHKRRNGIKQDWSALSHWRRCGPVPPLPAEAEERRARHRRLMMCISVNDHSAWFRSLAQVMPRSEAIMATVPEGETASSTRKEAHGAVQPHRLASALNTSGRKHARAAK